MAADLDRRGAAGCGVRRVGRRADVDPADRDAYRRAHSARRLAAVATSGVDRRPRRCPVGRSARHRGRSPAAPRCAAAGRAAVSAPPAADYAAGRAAQAPARRARSTPGPRAGDAAALPAPWPAAARASASPARRPRMVQLEPGAASRRDSRFGRLGRDDRLAPSRRAPGRVDRASSGGSDQRGPDFLATGGGRSALGERAARHRAVGLAAGPRARRGLRFGGAWPGAGGSRCSSRAQAHTRIRRRPARRSTTGRATDSGAGGRVGRARARGRLRAASRVRKPVIARTSSRYASRRAGPSRSTSSSRPAERRRQRGDVDAAAGAPIGRPRATGRRRRRTPPPSRARSRDRTRANRTSAWASRSAIAASTRLDARVRQRGRIDRPPVTVALDDRQRSQQDAARLLDVGRAAPPRARRGCPGSRKRTR